MSYEFLEHTADVKFVARAPTVGKLFVESALALKETMTKGTEIKGTDEKTIHAEGKDFESLLRNFLEEFLFLFDAEEFVLAEVKELMLDDEAFKLTAKLKGANLHDYELTNDVKAITYNEMYVKQTEKGWECQVVLDV